MKGQYGDYHIVWDSIMNKKGIISSVLAASMALSVVSTESVAQEVSETNSSGSAVSSEGNGSINDVKLYVTKTGETDSSVSVAWSSVENA